MSSPRNQRSRRLWCLPTTCQSTPPPARRLARVGKWKTTFRVLLSSLLVLRCSHFFLLHLSPFCLFGYALGLFDPIVIASLFGCLSGWWPCLSTALRRPRAWSGGPHGSTKHSSTMSCVNSTLPCDLSFVHVRLLLSLQSIHRAHFLPLLALL